MRILNLSSNDYANMAHENAKALRSIGVNCRDAKLQKHIFGYAGQSQIIRFHEIKEVVRSYDIIQIFHSDVHIFNEVMKYRPKRVIVYHTGTRYRENYELLNKHFERANGIITDQCEFMSLGDMDYLAPSVNVNLTPKRKGGKLIVGHFPSNPEVKGTAAIRSVLDGFRDKFEIRIDTRRMSHAENIKRMSECHVYIEMFKPMLNGNPYGCFGVTAFEAAAVGCKVITNCINQKAYTDVYGDMPFIIANTKRGLINSLNNIEQLTPAGLSQHSEQKTGERILKLIA